MGYRVLLAARRPNSGRRLLPDFLIIGAQKSGTTSLHLMLMQHPAIKLAFKHEVHFFDWNFDRGVGWYRTHFPTRSVRERSLQECGEFATGEKSPYYLFDPLVPARVQALLPDVKLVVLLRDPVARALSQYHMSRRHGHETRPLHEALTSELDQGGPAQRGLGVDYRRRNYLARGRYAEQLQRWLEHFDRRQLHVILSEQLFSDTAAVVCELHEFLGLTPVAPTDLTPSGQAQYAPMPVTLRRRLQEHFTEDVGRLATLIGADPRWW